MSCCRAVRISKRRAHGADGVVSRQAVGDGDVGFGHVASRKWSGSPIIVEEEPCDYWKYNTGPPAQSPGIQLQVTPVVVLLDLVHVAGACYLRRW